MNVGPCVCSNLRMVFDFSNAVLIGSATFVVQSLVELIVREGLSQVNLNILSIEPDLLTKQRQYCLSFVSVTLFS